MFAYWSKNVLLLLNNDAIKITYGDSARYKLPLYINFEADVTKYYANI